MHPRDNTEPIYWKLTPLGYHYKDRIDEKFAATGFYYYHQFGYFTEEETPSTGPYLVTNKHVIEPPEMESPDSIVAYQRNSANIQEVTRHNIPLYDQDGSPRWRVHPDNSKIDIAVIPVEFEVPDKCAFHWSDVVRTESASGGDLIQVIGYPNPLEDFYRLPIQRSALVSSPYNVAYHDNAFFYIDARLHDGMSGSPVLTFSREPGVSIDSVPGATKQANDVLEELQIEVDRSQTQNGLLGIHSAEAIEHDDQISLDDIRDQISDNDEDTVEAYLEQLEGRISDIEVESGLNRVWHAEYLDDIIRNIDL
ncbi:S1 family peptidase [Haloarcula argentinensis]|uniref:Serine protease n=1 Tax=Haloarcula argentinensis TaxID=43776 RepID=A0A830FWQ6_HALAR|nr:serine protease [Haloarcula argentinensis]GGM50673.1 hypothetical protein GCM10009006_34790 [Haloarcula argentinensis]